MKKTENQNRLNGYLHKYHLQQYFSDMDLPFELYGFARGEFLNNELDPYEYLCFLVSGSARIMHVRDDGSYYRIADAMPLTLFGDMEFAKNAQTPYLIEISQPAECVVLPLKQCAAKLRQDPVFLCYLLSSLARKLDMLTEMNAFPKNLKEKVLHYMTYLSPDHSLTGIEATATTFSFSRRQLLRILKSLCEENKIRKTGKGRYELCQPADHARE